MRLISPAESKAIDICCEKEGGPSLDDLMRNAGTAFFSEIRKKVLSVKNRRFYVLCGKGNNGGDGRVTAALLSKAGAQVRVFDMPLTEKEIPDFTRCDYILDCIFGTGFHGTLPEEIARVTDAVNASGKKVFSADIPTGVNGSDGSCDPHCIRAFCTVAFCGAKPGHALYPGREFCGRLAVCDIGVPEELVERLASPCHEYFAGSERKKLLQETFPKRPADTHKGSFGRTGVVAGSEGMCGAAALCAEAALRAGAGLVYSIFPRAFLPVMECLLRENVKLPVAAFAPEALEELLSCAGRTDTLAVGPGLGGQPQTAETARAFLKGLAASYAGRLVLDADALNAFEGRQTELAELLRRNDLGARTLITPHPAELSRITGLSVREICEERLSCAQNAAAELGCTVLLKGAATVTASPDGRFTVNGSGNPGMATAGSGDVLTGICAALLTRMSPYDAGRYGAFYHGVLGDNAVLTRGEYGMTAGDLLR